jgi:hypothetical protein
VLSSSIKILTGAAWKSCRACQPSEKGGFEYEVIYNFGRRFVLYSKVEGFESEGKCEEAKDSDPECQEADRYYESLKRRYQ